MVKKVLTFIIPVLVLIAIITYMLISNKNSIEFAVQNAIPNDASMIIEINDVSSFISNLKDNNEFWGDLIKIKQIRKFDNSLNFIDSLILKNQKINSVVKNNPLFLSIHGAGNRDYQILFYLNLNGLLNEKSINSFITDLLSVNLLTKTYSNEKIYYFANQDKIFSYCILNNTFLASFSKILLEQAIRQTKVENNILLDQNYIKVKETANSNDDANIYINYRNFSNLINPVVKSSIHSNQNLLHIADWTELDLKLKSNGILLTGFTSSNDSSNNYINIFKHQNPINSDIEQIIPSFISAFESYGISDYKQFITDYNKYIQLLGKAKDYTQKVNSFNKKYGVSIEKITANIFDEELGLLYDESDKNNKIAIIKTKSAGIVKEKLLDIIKTDARINRKKRDDYVFKHSIDNDLNYYYFKFPEISLPYIMFGDVLKGKTGPYFTFFENYLVFSNNKKLLDEFMRFNMLKKTYINEQEYKEFTEYKASQYNYYVYLNSQKSKTLLKNLLSENLYKIIENNYNNIKKIEGISFQFSTENDMLYYNIYTKHTFKVKEKPKTVWQSRLDTTIEFKPQFVKNHYTGNNEIFIQDLNNTIYLINQSGRILWKLDLPEKIMSEIYQVDCYKNNKLQLLFSTKNYIYLIDRNGNYVDKFPVKLRSEATNGLALFDYDKNKNYRLFIACANKKVYAYDIKGRLISGWKFIQSDNKITSQIQHFRINKKDYIVFADTYKIYILNRRGETRVKIKEHFSKSKNNNFILDSYNETGKARIVTTNTSGTVYFVYFNGDVKNKTIKIFSANHYFDFQNINPGKYKDFIFQDNGKLEVFSQNGKNVFEFDFKNKLIYPPVCYNFGLNDKKIGVVDEIFNKIYLVNNNGEIKKGFPLEGSTLFTIGKLNQASGKFNLIVGNNDIFLYNYIIH